jgi:hypothetical protein
VRNMTRVSRICGVSLIPVKGLDLHHRSMIALEAVCRLQINCMRTQKFKFMFEASRQRLVQDLALRVSDTRQILSRSRRQCNVAFPSRRTFKGDPIPWTACGQDPGSTSE